VYLFVAQDGNQLRVLVFTAMKFSEDREYGNDVSAY
jgi:hypothetical protein